MLYVFAGPSCTGKSAVADLMKTKYGVQTFAGKDFMRLAKNPDEAWKLFYEVLSEASGKTSLSEASVVYMVTELDQLDKVKGLNDARIITFQAAPEIVKTRFASRMGGNMPAPVSAMIDKQLDTWGKLEGYPCINTTEASVEAVLEQVLALD